MMKPELAAFPKAYMDALCIDGSMTLAEWIDLSGKLPIDGLEFYAGFLEMKDKSRWPEFRKRVEDQGRCIPMLCCSPDFTHPDPAYRREQIDREKGWIDMTHELGGRFCRVLSGQRRPEVSRVEGIGYCRDCIFECLEYAVSAGITLVIENHYKDNYWTYPEFAQKMDVFCELVEAIQHDHFGVNYDPSNTLLAGEDPIELLDRVKHRTVTMHASDRYLKEGTLDDLRREENAEGYAARLCHGEIGKGMNDYDAIFSRLQAVGFSGWISIEDGVNGFAELERSAAFLRRQIGQFWQC